MPPRKRQKMRFPLPSVTDVEGRRCVCLSIPDDPDHIGAFWGNLWSLSQWFNWEKTNGRHGKEVADVWREVWEIAHAKFDNDECCGDESDCEPTCQDYPAHSGIIQYKPSDPFLTPDYVPLPYPAHPFTVGHTDFLPGSKDGDVTFSYKTFFDNPLELAVWALENLPAWALSEITDYENWFNTDDKNLFPRFKIRFTGSGQVDLHLLKVPGGGLAYITLDGDPNGTFTPTTTFSLLEVESWLNGLSLIGFGSLTGSLTQVEIVQIVVEGEGDHYIDVTFIPKIEANLPSVGIGWGGGLRKIELCGVKPIVPIPATRENTTENCIEWLNPNTRIWECIAEIEPEKVCPDCGELLEEFCEECNDMACSKCLEGSVIYCDGKLQYKKADGTYADVPQSALPDDSIPPPPIDEIPSNAIACYKANGVWEAIELTIDALFDSYASAGGLVNGMTWYIELQRHHPEINADNAALFQFCSIQVTDVEAGEGALWEDLKIDLHDAFVCAMQSLYSKSSELSDAEIASMKNYEWDSGNEALDGFLDAAMVIPETSWLKMWAHNAVASQTGTCPCTDSGGVLPPIDDADWIHVFDFETSASILGWSAYTPPGGDPAELPTVSGAGLTGNVTTSFETKRRSVNLYHGLPLADETTIIKQVKLTWSATPSTNSTLAPERVIRLRTHAEAGALGTILGSIASDDFEVGTHTFTWDGLAWDDMDASTSMLMNQQIGARYPHEDTDPNGSIIIRRLELRGEGTNPFV